MGKTEVKLSPEGARALIAAIRAEQARRAAAPPSLDLEPAARGATAGRMSADNDHIKHFRASQQDADYYGLPDDHRYVEVRYDGTETSSQGRRLIDEIVTPGIHLEQMDADNFWMTVKGLHVYFVARRIKGTRKLAIEVTCEPQECESVVIEPEPTRIRLRSRTLAAGAEGGS